MRCLRLFTLLSLPLALLAGCQSPAPPVPRISLRVDSDPFMASVGQALQRTMPDVDLRLTPRGTASKAVFQEHGVDLALMPASDAYFAYLDDIERGTPAVDHLRAISALHTTPLLLAVQPESVIQGVSDLRGRAFTRILLLPPGQTSAAEVAAAAERERKRRVQIGDRPGTARLVELVLDAFGVEAVPVPSLQVLTAADALRRFAAGSLDAIFGTAYFTGDVIQAAAARGARLIPIDGPAIERLRQQYSFIRPAVIPPGTYPGQTEPIHTIGVDLLLVCRAGLDERLVHSLTRHYIAALPDLSGTNPSLMQIDLELASASPIPLHEGAARYYRESELFR
ncbi:MAG: TAXI family TRAP transporter solute-binding subunit [Vicinamibacterales bacterium]